MIRRIPQQHDNGCFIACVAMLLDITYQEAFQKIYPERLFCLDDRHVGLTPEKSLELMPKLGLRTKLSNLKNVRSLKKRTSLILLRWNDEPHRMHALIFDGETSSFVDPFYSIPPNPWVLNRNLEGIYYVSRINRVKDTFNPDNYYGRDPVFGRLYDRYFLRTCLV